MGVSDTNAYGWMQVSNSANLASGFVKDLVLQPVGGNLGLGVTTSAWNSVYKAMQFGPTGAIYSSSSNDSTFSNNTFWNASNSPRYLVTAAATYYYQNAGSHTWATAASGTAGNAISFTQAMTLNAGGDWFLGGTSNSGAIVGRNLYINTPSGANKITFAVNNASQAYIYHDTGEFTLGAPSGGSLKFQISGSATAATIDSSGNLLVGTTSSVGSERLNVTQSTGNHNARIINSGSSGNIYGPLFNFSAQAPNNGTSLFLVCSDNAATRAQIYSNGGIGNYSANNVNLSDERTKTNIQDAGGYLAKICAIPVRTFKYKDQTDDLLNLGCIAQEVEAVAPELVDASGFGETPEDGVPLKAIYQTDLQYALMKALQELKAEFDAYKASHP